MYLIKKTILSVIISLTVLSSINIYGSNDIAYNRNRPNLTPSSNKEPKPLDVELNLEIIMVNKVICKVPG